MPLLRWLAAPLRRPARFLLPLAVGGFGTLWLLRAAPARYQATAVVQAVGADGALQAERALLERTRLEALAEQLAAEAPGGQPTAPRVEQLSAGLHVRRLDGDRFA